MSIRFEDCDGNVADLAREIIAEYMPELRNVPIKYVYDLKKRLSGGKVVLGRCQKTNDLLRHLTIEESGEDEGYAYIIYLDKCAWENIEKADKIRLLRHELRHIEVDPDSERHPYKLIDHDVTDFAEEIALNTDDTRWAERVVDLAEQIYEQRRDQEADEE